MRDYLSWDLRVLKQIKQIKRIIIRKLLKLLFCIDYAKTVKQIFFYFWREGGKKSFDIINKSAHKSIKKGICKILCFSIFDLSSYPIFSYNVKDVSVIYKKINGSMNHRLWHASCHTIMIHTWFCDFIGPKYRSQSCDKTRTRIYISAKKKSIDYRTFTINYFLEQEWYLCPLTAVTYMCCIHVYCDIHLWWLYNMLENYKLHHPSNASNDNTRTMQKQLSNKFQAGTAKSAFFCAHTKCKL